MAAVPATPASPPRYRFADLTLDIGQRRLMRGSEPLPLSKLTFALLRVLVLHSDRGAPMISKTLAQLLADLDVARSFSRPHTSNDNPFSESAFKTAKYHPSYPGRFATLGEALAWGRQFFGRYNHEHKHSGIAFLAPADVYYGRAEQRLAHRHAVLQAAFVERPERFPHGPPKCQVLPAAT
jgi:putative transposase